MTERSPRPVAVARLTLTDFRNYAAARLEPEPDPARPVVLTGPNGAGKTNLLEALSYLGPGRGLRHARLEEVARTDGPGGWAVAATIRQDGADCRLGTGVTLKAGDPARREARIDGEKASGPAHLADRVSLVWLTPAMDRLFLDGAAGRRRFLDRFAAQIVAGHGAVLSAYDQAMRDRLRLLTEQGYLGADPAWLTALEARMAEAATSIAQGRRDAAAALEAEARGAAEEDGFPAADLALDGWVEAALSEASAETVAERFRVALKKARAGDARMGQTAIGPHRTDLAVTYTAKAMPARLCSTGEQKALLFSLVLAQARIVSWRQAAAPLVLMDEVAAHLDAGRRARLFERLTRAGGQAWLTGTDAALFQALGPAAQHYRVEAGTVRPQAAPTA